MLLLATMVGIQCSGRHASEDDKARAETEAVAEAETGDKSGRDELQPLASKDSIEDKRQEPQQQMSDEEQAIASKDVSTQTTQTKRALLIGIGEQKDIRWNKINGDNDIPVIKGVLKAAGYKETDIITLLNRQATKENIKNAFARLAGQCRRGDIIYVHFSGHGQQMTDLDGDEPEGLDETWIPYDAYIQPSTEDDGSKHLCDDEVHALMKVIRDKVGSSGKILVVVDACHSGSSTHGQGGESDGFRGIKDNFTITNVEKPVRKAPLTDQWTTLSACRSNQSNSECLLSDEKKNELEKRLNIKLKSNQVGKLTYAIYVAVFNNDEISNDQFITTVENVMDRNRGRSNNFQTPMFSNKYAPITISDILK